LVILPASGHALSRDDIFDASWTARLVSPTWATTLVGCSTRATLIA
jgi:hypothetical protein